MLGLGLALTLTRALTLRPVGARLARKRRAIAAEGTMSGCLGQAEAGPAKVCSSLPSASSSRLASPSTVAHRGSKCSQILEQLAVDTRCSHVHAVS